MLDLNTMKLSMNIKQVKLQPKEKNVIPQISELFPTP